MLYHQNKLLIRSLLELKSKLLSNNFFDIIGKSNYLLVLNTLIKEKYGSFRN